MRPVAPERFAAWQVGLIEHCVRDGMESFDVGLHRTRKTGTDAGLVMVVTLSRGVANGGRGVGVPCDERRRLRNKDAKGNEESTESIQSMARAANTCTCTE